MQFIKNKNNWSFGCGVWCFLVNKTFKYFNSEDNIIFPCPTNINNQFILKSFNESERVPFIVCSSNDDPTQIRIVIGLTLC